MRLQIKATGFELTPAIKSFVEEKFSSLSKFLDRWETNGEIALRIEVSKNTEHHNKGKVFYAEANLDIPKNMLRVEETDDELYEAIIKSRDRLKENLLKLKEKTAKH